MSKEIIAITTGGAGKWVEFDYGDGVVESYSFRFFMMMQEEEKEAFENRMPVDFQLMAERAKAEYVELMEAI